MFLPKTEVFGILLLCCCSSEGAIKLNNRTSVALVNETVSWHVTVDVPVNSSASVQCYMKQQEVWKHHVIGHPKPGTQTLTASITMNNPMDSGEFFFQYLNERVYGVVLVLDEVVIPETSDEILVVSLLAFAVLLLLFNVSGSVYVFRFYKKCRPAKVEANSTKKQKTKKKTVVKEETATSESVYTALTDSHQVSVYDVLNVDEVRRTSRDSQIQVNTSTVEEGIFESVYENLETL